MTPVIAHDTFRDARCAGGIEDVKGIGCGDRHAINRFRARHQFRPIQISPGNHGRL